ncbi:unnamed protein product [Lactuca virosa]|uniref:Uncharacterized protein n=1 Tax=Lactuca virosa TaxID=75947 RepID=A0AAU9NSV7_9ASTR|nr:unnamed protein product [Lactuca virosa]
MFPHGISLYRSLSQAYENSKAVTLVTLHTNRTASNSSRKIRRWCSPQQKFSTQGLSKAIFPIFGIHRTLWESTFCGSIKASADPATALRNVYCLLRPLVIWLLLPLVLGATLPLVLWLFLRWRVCDLSCK